jgi:hypothetical protein
VRVDVEPRPVERAEARGGDERAARRGAPGLPPGGVGVQVGPDVAGQHRERPARAPGEGFVRTVGRGGEVQPRLVGRGERERDVPELGLDPLVIEPRFRSRVERERRGPEVSGALAPVRLVHPQDLELAERLAGQGRVGSARRRGKASTGLWAGPLPQRDIPELEVGPLCIEPGSPRRRERFGGRRAIARRLELVGSVRPVGRRRRRRHGSAGAVGRGGWRRGGRLGLARLHHGRSSGHAPDARRGSARRRHGRPMGDQRRLGGSRREPRVARRRDRSQRHGRRPGARSAARRGRQRGARSAGCPLRARGPRRGLTSRTTWNTISEAMSASTHRRPSPRRTRSAARCRRG